jgi:hypothetical protein
MRVCYSDGRQSKWIDEENMIGKLTFTDDDLKRLKEYVEKLRGLKVSTMATVDTSKLIPLIARLEAAEKCAWWADYGATYIPVGNLDDCNQALENWRKAAGK